MIALRPAQPDTLQLRPAQVPAFQ
ncbi:hypothetical protein A2U01_0079253, partial [Trifolium medium]|nr:hypothetical protein [Trifolium medium]